MVGKNEKRSPEVRERESGRWDLRFLTYLQKCY